MSQEHLESRVADVERGQAQLSADVRMLSHDVAGIKGDLGRVSDGVGRLLERDARRPDALTWKTIGASIGLVLVLGGGLATFVWWMVGASPSVRTIEDRLSELDSPRAGRVTVIERHLEATAPSWGEMTVKKGR